MGYFWTGLICLIIGAVGGFIGGKFWNSRKISATVAALKAGEGIDKIKDIWIK